MRRRLQKRAQKRFTRWADKGLWQLLFNALSRDRDNEYLMIDSSIVRADAQAATGKEKRRIRLWGTFDEG